MTATYIAQVVQSKVKRRAPGAKYVARDIDDLMAGCPDIGAALRSARMRQGLTQRQLARAMGVHEGTIGRWEHGDTPHRSSVRKVAAALGLSLKELLPSHASAKYSDEVLRTVITMKRTGYSSEQVSATTGVSVRHVSEVYAGSSRSYVLDTTTPDIRDLIAACPNVGAAIRAARHRKGLTLHQLAWAIRVHETTPWQWERDRRQPGASAVRRVATAFGMTVEELLSVEANPTEPTTYGQPE